MAFNGPETDARKLDGQVIISELLRDVDLGRFEMAYSTLLPCIFRVYLHPDDYNRLKGINDLIVEDAPALSAPMCRN